MKQINLLLPLHPYLSNKFIKQPLFSPTLPHKGCVFQKSANKFRVQV